MLVMVNSDDQPNYNEYMGIHSIRRLIYWAAIFTVTVLALLPSENLQLPLFDWWDKAQHLAAFALLTLLGLAAYPKAPIRVLSCLLLYALAIECVQYLSGWRVGEWQDVVADVIGEVLAWAVFRMFTRWRDS